MDFDRRSFLECAAATAAFPTSALAQSTSVLRPEDFGAQGDGSTNDTAAFARLSAEVNRRGGGDIHLAAGRTYVVSDHIFGGGGEWGWTPEPVLRLLGLSRPLRIFGNGARLRCRPGLRYGTFDRTTGAASKRPMPNYARDEIASPYQAMVWIQNCRAPVEVRDLELDGNVERLLIGGRWGDTGWQLPATGLWLIDNRSTETLRNVYSHHHAQDGLMINGDDRRTARSRITRFVAHYNGRQGASIVGGRGYDFEDCDFSFTGRSAVASAPGAGVDIEAEGDKINRDFTFTRCRFADNFGVGLLADSGDSADARFLDCQFVGATTWSAWPRKPRFRFERCLFAGSVVHAFPSTDPIQAARFINCRFVDDLSLSPRRTLYLSGEEPGAIVNLGESRNVRFERCAFELRNKGMLPWSWQAIYSDCTMSQVAHRTAMTKGKYIGRNTIEGPVDLYGSIILGTLMVNGKMMPRGPVGADIEIW